jgi:hypothetical protein
LIASPNPFRRSVAQDSSPPNAIPPSANKFNPFSAFQGLTSGPTPIAPPTNNPFAGFSGLTSTAKGVSSGSSIPNATSTIVQNSSQTISFGLDETEYQKKVKKLNQAFLTWADRQIKENAIAVWKDGVKVS